MRSSRAFSVVAAVLLSLPILASAAYGHPFEGNGFVAHDWQVVCDNTLTCRAAGYTNESAEWRGSILMTVMAGKKVPDTQVLLNDWESANGVVAQLESSDPVELFINDKSYGKVNDSKLTNAQTAQLIKHAKQNSKIVFVRGPYQWHISDKGMAAVLLKLDETQGRVGTPLALVSKNSPNRQSPKAGKAKPIIKKAFAYAEKDNKQLSTSKLTYFQKHITQWVDINSKQLVGSDEVMGECELVNPNTESYQRIAEYGSNMLVWEFIPVDEHHTLAVHGCWTGAYNFSSGYWLIDNRMPSKAELITTAGNEYYEGQISAIHKGRGLGDCWSMTEWVWNGKTFVKAFEQTTGLCRMIEAGGAWSLPTYVSEVIGDK